ncbi:MAG TPA: hypothetical protein VJ508_05975 [Saprospiraceae bacterium]|nr:hypothetical protein [Saprospiraceae bacterium]
MIRKFLNGILFGNYFYGFCAVALCIEASLQQRYPVSEPIFLLLVFLLTIWYYTLAYQTDMTMTTSPNPRTRWYVQHKRWIQIMEWICMMASMLILGLMLYRYGHLISGIRFRQWILIFIVPLAAGGYYGIQLIPGFNLRRIGWLKPFVIGFTWAGFTTIYPVLYYHITHQSPDLLGPYGWWLFLKNFMFVSVLCIMFDIKDYASDSNQNIKTFVVAKGLKYTLFNILIPLTIIGLMSFIIFSLLNHFALLRIAFNMLPFVALLLVAYALQRRQSIFFYLFVIDGLMLFKAICGSLGALFT